MSEGDLPTCEHGTADPCFETNYRAALRARRLFEKLMEVEDGGREWEHLEPRVRKALDRIVDLTRPKGQAAGIRVRP